MCSGRDFQERQSKNGIRLQVVEDFKPHIVFLVNDLYWLNTEETFQQLQELLELFNFIGVDRVFVSQVTHRLQSNSSRYQVNIDSFNEKVDTINKLLFTDKKISFWYLKDFWGAGCKQDTICHDWVHLTEAGQQKLLKNIRAAVV